MVSTYTEYNIQIKVGRLFNRTDPLPSTDLKVLSKTLLLRSPRSSGSGTTSSLKAQCEDEIRRHHLGGCLRYSSDACSHCLVE